MPPEELQDPPDGWPRRLLYIPDMISLEWQEGNYYGDVKEPEYAVMSYTWGRYAHKSCQGHSVIQINAIPWKPPCICTNHFSSSEFTQIIKNLDTEYQVKYLWLDVACIDQRPDSREKDLEVGRQYAIFRKAAKAFFWLTTIHEVEDLADVYSIHPDVRTWVSQHLDFLKDPWFTSLWTFQEAFICWGTDKPTYFLTRSGRELQLSLSTYQRIDESGYVKRDPDQTDEEASWMRQLSEKLDSAGLRAIVSKNPVALYRAVEYRTASKPQDQIYGIQQVFEFRLGNTAERPEKENYSLKELRYQFGMAFVRKYPVESQLCKFSDKGEDGHSWRVSPTTTLLRNARFLSILNLGVQFKECYGLDLDEGKQLDAMYFSGQVCPAKVFNQQIQNDKCIEEFHAFDDRDCAAEAESRLSQDREDVGKPKLVVLLLGRYEHTVEGLPVSDRGGVVLLERLNVSQQWYRCGFWIWRIWPKSTSSEFRDLKWEDEKGYIC